MSVADHIKVLSRLGSANVKLDYKLLISGTQIAELLSQYLTRDNAITLSELVAFIPSPDGSTTISANTVRITIPMLR
jgi:hypothetical protein